MSEANHTAGPWHVHESFRADKVSVLADVDLPHGRRAVTRTVAECGYPGDETNANAELIAQAPETKAQRDALLEVLQAMTPVFEGLIEHLLERPDIDEQFVIMERVIIDRAKTAIRRAQGGGDE